MIAEAKAAKAGKKVPKKSPRAAKATAGERQSVAPNPAAPPAQATAQPSRRGKSVGATASGQRGVAKAPTLRVPE